MSKCTSSSAAGSSAVLSTAVVCAGKLCADDKRHVGTGAFGVVWCVRSQVSGRQLAVKKLADVDTLSSTRRVYNELCALTHLSHENILSAQEIILLPATADEFREVYVMTELMATDMRRVLASGQRLSASQVQLFLYQILTGLQYLHSFKVIHGDIKPENVFVNADCRLKLGDFGLVTKESTEREKDCMSPDEKVDDTGEGDSSSASAVSTCVGGGGSTDVQGTLSYAAPELLLGVRPVTCAADVWATGCLAAEMLTGRVLFQAANVMQQLDVTIDLLGVSACGMEDFTEAGNPARRYLRSKLAMSSRSRATTLGSKPLLFSLLKTSEQSVQYLLPRLLKFSPKQRISARNALQHVESGRTLYHSTLCHCCQHATTTQEHRPPTATDCGTATCGGLGRTERERRTTDAQQLAGSNQLPGRLASNIPLDNDLENHSAHVLKEKIRKLCRQTTDSNGSSQCHHTCFKSKT